MYIGNNQDKQNELARMREAYDAGMIEAAEYFLMRTRLMDEL